MPAFTMPDTMPDTMPPQLPADREDFLFCIKAARRAGRERRHRRGAYH